MSETTKPTRTLVALLAGGISSEADVSRRSAEGIARMLPADKYDVYTVWVDVAQWSIRGGEYDGIPVNKDDFSFMAGDQTMHFEFAYITIHGHPGENGVLQGYFETLGIPYSGSGVLASALTFNKLTCNRYVQQFGIQVPKSLIICNGEEYRRKKIVEQLGLPCFIKPRQGGSSFGISKVSNLKDFDAAVQDALKEDSVVIVEEFIDGTELTCGALKTEGEELLFPITEIVSKNDFFDYQAKYNAEYADEITPARIPESVETDIKFMTSKLYDLLECNGIVRADFIWKDEKIYFLEINTVPGMTERSLIPQEIEAMGLQPGEVLHKTIEDAIKRMSTILPGQEDGIAE